VLTSVHHLVRYAIFAYHDDDGLEFEAHTAADLRHTRMVQSTLSSHTHAHLAIRNGNTLVLAFRGTDFPMTLQNLQRRSRFSALLYNAVMDISYNLIRLDWPGLPHILVHEGFLSSFNDLIGNLVLNINDILGHTAPTNIEVCGHSLGGALATLCALWCRLQWPTATITCVTLGSPRVGEENFAREFNNRNILCYRLIFSSDPVAKVPNRFVERLPIRYSAASITRVALRQGGYIWKHVGQRIYLTDLPPANLLERSWQAVTFAAHDPMRYLTTVQKTV
ncbi:Alpha/Beta hydrolase protein, partial [Fusarium oxysporum]